MIGEEPLGTSEIPSEDTIIALGKALLDSTVTWKKGKAYAKDKVLTLSRRKEPADGAPWHCRVSEHTKEDATFDEFWSKLGVNKAENEKEYDPHIVCPHLHGSFRYQVYSPHQESCSSETYIRNASNLDSLLHVSISHLPACFHRAPDRSLGRVFSKIRVSHLSIRASRSPTARTKNNRFHPCRSVYGRGTCEDRREGYEGKICLRGAPP